MRFREANAADVPAIAATFDGRNALPLAPRVREELPALLDRLIASPACALTVFEEDAPSGFRVLSCAGGLFLRQEVIDAYLAAPHPGLLSGALAALLDGRMPLLSLEEIRQANSREGLVFAVLPIAHGRLDWADPRLEQLRKLAPQAFVRAIGGYRLRAIYYEVFTDEVAAYLQAGSYRLLHDFSSQAGTGFLPQDCKPRMLRLTGDDLPPGAMSMASQMFNPPAARLGLTLAEQRVALRALDGASDRAIAHALGLSTETVRSNWRSLYQRLVHVLEDPQSPLQHGDDASRGLEKRRVAIEYLRQNMHELRPTLRATARDRPRAT
jgi:DNA-binding CsgD family transcriptional regulator